MKIGRKIWSIVALAISFGVFALLGYDLSDPGNWITPVLAGLALYFLGLGVLWAVSRMRGEP